MRFKKNKRWEIHCFYKKPEVSDNCIYTGKGKSENNNCLPVITMAGCYTEEEEKMKLDYETLKPEDLEEGELKIELTEDAFEAPLTCTSCNKKMEKVMIDFELPGREITMHLEAYRCKKCRKEYLSGQQAEKFDAMLSILDAMKQQAKIKFERAANFDGKNWFIRFPSDLTKSWDKHMETEIIPITQKDFLIHLKRDKLK